jgi:hypothetical protein
MTKSGAPSSLRLGVKIECVMKFVCFRDDPALVDSALVDTASVKNDVYIWIYIR